MYVSGQLHASGGFTSWESAHWLGGWLDSIVGIEAVEKIKIYCPYQELNPGRSARNLSLYRLSYSSSHPRTIQERKKNITSECRKIMKQMLHGFQASCVIRVCRCLQVKGGYSGNALSFINIFHPPTWCAIYGQFYTVSSLDSAAVKRTDASQVCPT
jgi:hypothetical protein